ncbi:MAG: Shikimate dehydrogenase, partial [Pseudomonadota bacterium]
KDIVVGGLQACNTIVNQNGKLIGYNTDFIGVQKALEKHCDLSDKRVAIFGSGGGAKSAVFGVLKKTKNITLFNRSKDKNNEFAKQYNIQNQSLNDFNADNFDIIINATTVGMNSDECVLDLHNQNKLSSQHTVFDMVYSPLKTKLLQVSERQGAKIIFGTEMLIYQALEQFELYTDSRGYENAMRFAIEKLQIENTACIVVHGKEISEFTKSLQRAKYYNRMLELRVDYITDLSQNDVDTIAKQIDCQNSIFTCRMKKDGGGFGGSVEECMNIINYAINLKKFAYFDVDIANANLIGAFKNDCNIILSYHNFEKCLSFNECIEVIEKMNKYRHSMKKIAMKVQNTDEIKTMIDVINYSKNANQKLIFAPMCDEKMLRLLAMKMGSEINFFALDENAKTADGQMTIVEFEKIKNIIL